MTDEKARPVRHVSTDGEQGQRPDGEAGATADAEPRRLDETVPGGRYVVDDRTVDADGNEVRG